VNSVRSKDGTTIAFDRLGEGPPIILAGGAFSYRAFPKLVQLAELLAPGFTVINYDRRGRGDSADTAPYAVEREIEDLQDIHRLVMFEPPFLVDDSRPLPPADFANWLAELTATERRSDATRLFMTKAMGIPGPIVRLMRFSPIWSKLTATAHTLPYDWALLGDTMSGKPLSRDDWASATVPTLVLAGEKSPEQLRNAARAIAGVLPNAEHRELEGQSHNPSMKVMAPVLREFFSDRDRSRLHPAA